MKRLFFSGFFFCLGIQFLIAQTITGLELLEKSIQYHDPKSEWTF